MECPASQSDHTVLESADFTLKLWVRCCHPSSSHKEIHGDLGPGIDQPDFKEVSGGEILRIRQIMIILETIVDEVGGTIHLCLSVCVCVSIWWVDDHPCFNWPTFHGTLAQGWGLQKADVFCCQAKAEGPVLAGWPNFPATPQMLQFVILFLDSVSGCRNPSQ